MTDQHLTTLASHLSNNFADVNPFLIFEHVNTYLERISFRQVSAESLAAALKPYINIEQLSLDQFVDNAKYIRAAYLLGVRKFQPRFKDDTFGLAIYESDNLTSNEKQELFEWLLQENYFSSNPLSLKTMCKGLEHGKDLSFACLLRYFPINESQIVGYYPIEMNPSDRYKRNNILHAAVYNGGILKIWKSIMKIYSLEEVMQLLFDTNMQGRSALFLIISNYFNHDNRMPKEILLALIRISQSGNFDVFIKDLYWLVESSIANLMYKYGMTPTEYSTLQESPFASVHNAYRFKEESNKNVETRSTSESMTEGDLNSLDVFPINTLLPEIIWLIAEYLDITGLVGLFTMSKTMATLLRKKDDRFWRQIYERNLYPNKKIHNYKTMALQYARSAPNWLNRNFKEIKLDNGLRASSLMDENWLVLLDDENIYLWDCHTHKVHWICSVLHDNTKLDQPIRILGGVYNGICPPILVRYSDTAHRYFLAVNGEFNELPIQQQLHRNHFFPAPYQIDENMLLLHDSRLLDIQSNIIVDTTHFNNGYLIYNPFNHTYATLYNREHLVRFEVRDMNHNLIRQFDAKKHSKYYNFIVLDESKLLWIGNAGRDYVLIDFSNIDVVETMFTLNHSIMSKLILPCSLNRAILADDRTGLVTICHFPSMQWEAVYHLQATITAANSRYLVGNEDGSAVIYDFCK